MSHQHKHRRVFAGVALVTTIAMLAGCHNWMYSVGKGRPPNPEPNRDPPKSAVVVEWVHPLACKILFHREGRDVLGTLLILDRLPLEQNKVGDAILPGWMWESGSEILYPRHYTDEHYMKSFPVGSTIQIDYPLMGRATYPSSAGEGMPASSGGVRVYNGYIGIPRLADH